jgi:hypothetical protein
MGIMITPPARLTIWRLALALSTPLAWLSVAEAFQLAKKLGISPLASKSWLALIGILALTGLLSLVLLILSFTLSTPSREKLLDRWDGFVKPGRRLRWAGYPILVTTLAAYPLILFHPYLGELLARQTNMRLFLFWVLALVIAGALEWTCPRSMPRGLALIAALLLQSAIQRASLYLPDISAYPFAMGWSETSRFYYPALFLGRKIFGETIAWPILHPTLHITLVPPYLLDAPLWFHRTWQVLLRFLLVALIAPALLSRLQTLTRGAAWLTGLWIVVSLFTLPLYLHLAVPVIIMLWGFSPTDRSGRAWVWLALASIWAGLSRLNWYPMPGMLAAGLYFLEVPYEGKFWKYLSKPVLWFAASTALAFFAMQAYIAFSGIPNPGDFYTSLSSTKLWERLWPNDSYSLGVIPGSVIFSAPFWLVLWTGLRRLDEKHPMRAGLLLLELLVLYAGGLLVSTKIGGGADIHNMDAYAVLLVIITAHLLLGPRNAPVIAKTTSPGQGFHWSLIALLVLVPAWFGIRSTATFWKYDSKVSGATLAALQKQVEQVNAQGGEILFITQRHLITMGMLEGVKLVPEYEREELMEMTMAQNDAYLQTFRADMQNQRFAAIVVDPLRFNFIGEQDAMGAENNAWTRAVVKKVLCSYQQAAIFPADRIAIYVPQVGEQKCP